MTKTPHQITTDFSIVIENYSSSLKTSKPTKVVMQRPSGSKAELKLTSENAYHVAIFQALLSGVNSEWFGELSEITQRHAYRIVHPFVIWMNTVDKNRDPKNRYECLIDFNVYRKNEARLKTSTVHRLKRIIEHGLVSQHLIPEDHIYLENLLKLSRVPPDEEAQGHSLTQWFTQFDLRNYLGEEKFLMLESPRQLITSFRVTIAVTLLFLIEARQLWKERPSPEVRAPASGRRWFSDWNRSVLKLKGKFDRSGASKDILTHFLVSDLIIRRMHTTFSNAMRFTDISSIPDQLEAKKVWQVPKLFTPDYDDFYTELEEVLAGWLIASLAVQPSDVGKLKSSNFAVEYTPNGRVRFMQIKYYKGRADSLKESDIISGSDVTAQALHSYIKNLPQEGRLFRQEFNKSLQFPDLRSTYNSKFGLFFRIWFIPEVKARLDSELNRAKTSSLFLDAIHAIIDSESKFTNRKKAEDSERTQFIFLFRLAHIKTTAVHAQSDKYRESDLVNHNSHSSITEKQAYLTDQNAEWVNQCGRVTRLVLYDLQNVVYQPSIETIRRNVSELCSRTSLTHNLEINENDIKNIYDLPATLADIYNSHQLVVADSVDSALVFIHYIKQAEIMFEKLNRLRPDFVEQTLIIQIEWMTQMLSKMKSARPAQVEYSKLQKHLPSMFDYLLQTNE